MNLAKEIVDTVRLNVKNQIEKYPLSDPWNEEQNGVYWLTREIEIFLNLYEELYPEKHILRINTFDFEKVSDLQKSLEKLDYLSLFFNFVKIGGAFNDEIHNYLTRNFFNGNITTDKIRKLLGIETTGEQIVTYIKQHTVVMNLNCPNSKFWNEEKNGVMWISSEIQFFDQMYELIQDKVFIRLNVLKYKNVKEVQEVLNLLDKNYLKRLLNFSKLGGSRYCKGKFSEYIDKKDVESISKLLI